MTGTSSIVPSCSERAGEQLARAPTSIANILRQKFRLDGSTTARHTELFRAEEKLRCKHCSALHHYILLECCRQLLGNKLMSEDGSR